MKRHPLLVIALLLSLFFLCGLAAATAGAIRHGAINPPTWVVSGGPLSIAAAQPCNAAVWAPMSELPCLPAREWVVTVQVHTSTRWRHWKVLSIPLLAQERDRP